MKQAISAGNSQIQQQRSPKLNAFMQKLKLTNIPIFNKLPKLNDVECSTIPISEQNELAKSNYDKVRVAV